MAQPRLIHEFFEREVSRRPHATALVFEDDEGRQAVTLTYKQLDDAASRIARILRCEIGLRLESLVAVRLDRCPGMVVVLLGVLKAGAAYVPVDPTFPPERQEVILSDSRASVMITSIDLLHQTARQEGVVRVVVDAMGEATTIQGLPTSLVPHPTTASHTTSPLAYVLFTSGSTGRPKGVMVEHESVVNTLTWFAEELCLCHSDRVLGLTTYCFDISVLELFMPLMHGCVLYLVASATQKDGVALMQALSQGGITIMQATPATYEILMACGWEGDDQLQALCGGEAFRLNLAPLVSKCRSFRNVYGPTETTIWSTCHLLTEPPSSPVPLGRPISHTRLYVLDHTRQPCPPGTEGELYISGLGVARGYWAREDLTEQRFLPCPWRELEEHTRMYATGDVVMWEADGQTLKYVGRADSQVKLNGYRIELGEIEKLLQVLPGVQTAVVVVRDDHGSKALVGYLQAPDDSHPSLQPQTVLQELAKHLPKYMLPSYLVLLSELPLTPNGKIDRQRLPPPPKGSCCITTHQAARPRLASCATTEPYSSSEDGMSELSESDDGHRHSAIDIIPPRRRSSSPSLSEEEETEDEARRRFRRIISGVIAKVSGVRSVHGSYDLRMLRLDSLGAVMVTHRLSTTLGGLRVRPVEVYEAGTVKDLANKLYDRVLSEKPSVVRELGLPTVAATSSSPASSAPVGSDDERLLTGLRGLLILWVCFEHWTMPLVAKSHGARFGTSTAYFGMLSGFTLFLWWMQSRSSSSSSSSSSISWPSYFFSKATGLLPSYYLALLACLPWYISLRNRPGPPQELYQHSPHLYAVDAAYHITAMQAWDQPVMLRGVPFIWYASIQWNLYLLFAAAVGLLWPLAAPHLSPHLSTHPHRRLMGFAGLALFSFLLPAAVRRATWHTDLFLSPIGRHGTLLYVPELLLGMATAGAYTCLHTHGHGHKPRPWWVRLAHLLAPWALLAAFAILVFDNKHIPGHGWHDRFLCYVVLPLLAMGLLLLLLLARAGPSLLSLRGLLCCDMLVTAGDLSLPIYLFHSIISKYYYRMAVERWPSLLAPLRINWFDLSLQAYFDHATVLLKAILLLSIVAACHVIQHQWNDKVVLPLLLRLTTACSRLGRPTIPRWASADNRRAAAGLHV